MLPMGREFKLDAVRKFLAQDESAGKFAQKIGVSQPSLSKWVREYKETGDIHEPKGICVATGRPRMVQLTTTLPPVIERWVDNEAEKRNITKAEYVRKVLITIYRRTKAREAE